MPENQLPPMAPNQTIAPNGMSECPQCWNTINMEQPDTYTSFNDYIYHRDCLHLCNFCRETIPPGASIYYHGRYYHNAGACFWNYYMECGECGEIYARDLIDEGFECPCQKNAIIHQYNYKPKPKFSKLVDEQEPCLYMGLELEVEDMDSVGISYVRKKLWPIPEIYCKYDGSLSYGFEIVSHPMTLGSHHKFDWTNILQDLRANQFDSDNRTCGLHIHASKSVLNELEKTRLAIFINTQYQRIEVISRRSSERYAKFKKYGKGMFKAYYNEESKYEALNWYPEQTVEFRMFKGTLDINCLYASLEFVHSSIMFVKNVHSTLKLVKPEMAWERYCKFLHDHKEEYTHLPSYLEKHSLLERGINAN